MDDDSVARAFLASALMDEMRDYLARGRLFEKLSPEQLIDGWVTAFRIWFSKRESPREINDYPAKFRLS